MQHADLEVGFRDFPVSPRDCHTALAASSRQYGALPPQMAERQHPVLPKPRNASGHYLSGEALFQSLGNHHDGQECFPSQTTLAIYDKTQELRS